MAADTGLSPALRATEESVMNWSKWIRQLHRWLSMTFTVAVLANFAVLGRGQIATVVGLLTLVPLALLMLTGLYLFVLPHATRWRARRAG